MTFNFIPTTITELTESIEKTELPEFKEIAVNFDIGDIDTIGGQNYLVTKNHALKIWIWKTLQKGSTRFTNLAYSDRYGNEMHKLIGRALQRKVLFAELKRYITEALTVNPYIKELTDFKFDRKGATVFVEFMVITIYGSFKNELEYVE